MSSRPFSSFFMALVPSWRFFDRVGHVPRLYFRSVNSDEPSGNWEPVLAPPTPDFNSFFLNPAGQLYHANHRMVDRLAAEVSESEEDWTSSVSYRLVCRLVRHEMLKRGLGPHFQFKIQVADPKQDSSYEALLSAVHEV